MPETTSPAHVYLLLGANLGDKEAMFIQARAHIAEQVGVITRRSCLYETAAWGGANQPTYLNQVVVVEAWLSPVEVLSKTQAIEQRLGRVRTEKWGSRVIDIDLLFYDDLVLNTPTLRLPHPLLHLRRFTLVPLAEIAPELIHPVLKESIHTLLVNCTDQGEVIKFS